MPLPPILLPLRCARNIVLREAVVFSDFTDLLFFLRGPSLPLFLLLIVDTMALSLLFHLKRSFSITLRLLRYTTPSPPSRNTRFAGRQLPSTLIVLWQKHEAEGLSKRAPPSF